VEIAQHFGAGIGAINFDSARFSGRYISSPQRKLSVHIADQTQLATRAT
jgi:hypothetical protein